VALRVSWPASAYCRLVLATPLALKARLTARPPPSQAAAALPLAFSALPPTRAGRLPLLGLS
jgi:hypothetical protein